MFVETRLAMNVSTSGSSTSIESYFTFRRRIAMRVSRSGGWMSVISPHSNRERRRSSSVAMSRGGRSELMIDLPPCLVQRVEGVEELLLDPLLVLEELHVVDQQDVVGAVALLEPFDPLVAEAVDEVVHERLRGDVADRHVRVVLADVVRDRVQQVRLSEARVAVDEEWVVGLRRRLGHCQRGGVGEPVRRADHEGVEGVLRVDAAPSGRGTGGGGGAGRVARGAAAAATAEPGAPRRRAGPAAPGRSHPSPPPGSARGSAPRSTRA